MKISDPIAPSAVVPLANTNGSSGRAHATNGICSSGGGADAIVPIPAEADVPASATKAAGHYTNGHASAGSNGNGVSVTAPAANGTASTLPSVSPASKDGNFFLAIMQVERERLLALGDTADGYLADVSALNEVNFE